MVLSTGLKLTGTLGKALAQGAKSRLQSPAREALKTERLARVNDPSVDVLSKIKDAQLRRANIEINEITNTQQFKDFANNAFNRLTINGIPPTRKQWGKEIGITGDNSLHKLLNNRSDFKNLKFLTNEQTYMQTLTNPSFRISSNQALAKTNFDKALDKANSANSPIIHAAGKKPKFVFPENKPEIKQKFLLDLEKATAGNKFNRSVDYRDMSKSYGLNYSDFTSALRTFKKEEGLLNNPKYNLIKLTQGGTKKARDEAISQWKRNPNTLKTDIEIYNDAQATIKLFNASNPRNKQNLDHIKAFINSKNKIDAQTLDNLQITTKNFNQNIKATMFEKPASGFKLLDKQIKKTKDKVLKANLVKSRKELFKQYKKTIEETGYFMDTTGMPFLPKSMQISNKLNVREKLQFDINNLRQQLDNQFYKSVKKNNFNIMSPRETKEIYGFSKGGSTNNVLQEKVEEMSKPVQLDFKDILDANETHKGLEGQVALDQTIREFLDFNKDRKKFLSGGAVSIDGGGVGSSVDNQVGMFQSILSGIGAGIIDIPKGAFSLGASLMDLGLGTSHAAGVEKFFDDLTTLDEKAEATTAGKITRIMTNLGIPGTYAFKTAAGLSKKALLAKKSGTYWKPTKNAAGELEKTLTNKGRMRTTLQGVAGVGASDAIFVGDAEQVGTLGDAFDIGPTQLADNDENNAARTVMNRVKFGIDSAFLGGVIGGTGTAIKQAVQRSNKLKRNNDFIDKILEYTTPQGRKTKEFFEMERELIGKRSADSNRIQELHRQLDKNIDALYPFVSRISGVGVQKERDAMVKVINNALTSGKPNVKEVVDEAGEKVAQFTLGDMDAKALSELRKLKLKDPEEVIKILQQSRRIMDNSFTAIGNNILKSGAVTKEAADATLDRFGKFKTAFETKSLDWINDTYQIYGNKSSDALKGFRPADEAITNAKELFKQLSLKRTGKAMSDEDAAYEVERILESTKKTMSKSPNKALSSEAEGVPFIKDETGFLKDTAISDWTKEYLPLNKLAKDELTGSLTGLTPKNIMDDLLGKVNDPSATILNSMSKLSLIRRKYEFFDDLNETMMGKQFFTSRREAAKVFGDNNVYEKGINMQATQPGGSMYTEALNPLQGVYTSKGIQDALEGVNKGFFDFTEADNIFASMYNNLLLYPKATSQLAKTVLSPITHVRNLISAAAFSAANGIMPLMNKEALDEAMGAFRQVGAKGSEASNKRYRELLRLGVVNKNARLGDLEDLLADIDFGSKASQMRAIRSFTKAGSKFKEGATDLYTAEDDFWKMFTFATERSRISKALEKAGIDKNVFATSADNDLGRVFANADEYLDEAAANIVRNNVPNYDYVSKFVKDLRRAPFGNFVSFPAEIMRTSVNIMGKGLKEFNYVDPVTGAKPFRAIGMQRLAGFGATAVAIPYATVEAFKAAYNVSGIEMDALRRFVPDWSKNSTLIPIKDEDGKLKYIDFSHANAYDTMIRPFKTVMNAIADGRTDNDTIMEDVIQGTVEATSELGSPFISESIWTQAIGDVFLRGGRTKDGRRLYTDQTPFGDRVFEAAKHMAEAQYPGSIKQGQRLFQSITKNPDEYGRTFELKDEALGFAGLRAVEIDPVTSMKFKIASFRTGINNARREFTSPLLKGGPVTPEQIVDRYKIANEALYKVQKEMSQDYYGALILGAGNKPLQNEFKDRVSNAQLRAIIGGDFKPFIPSENIQKAFRDNANKIGQGDPYSAAKATINRIARQYNKLKLFDDALPDIENPFSASTVGLPSLNTTQTSLPGLNTGINSLTGGTSSLGLNRTMQKGQQVFGPNDTIFGS